MFSYLEFVVEFREFLRRWEHCEHLVCGMWYYARESTDVLSAERASFWSDVCAKFREWQEIEDDRELRSDGLRSVDRLSSAVNELVKRVGITDVLRRHADSLEARLLSTSSAPESSGQAVVPSIGSSAPRRKEPGGVGKVSTSYVDLNEEVMGWAIDESPPSTIGLQDERAAVSRRHLFDSGRRV